MRSRAASARTSSPTSTDRGTVIEAGVVVAMEYQARPRRNDSVDRAIGDLAGVSLAWPHGRSCAGSGSSARGDRASRPLRTTADRASRRLPGRPRRGARARSRAGSCARGGSSARCSATASAARAGVDPGARSARRGRGHGRRPRAEPAAGDPESTARRRSTRAIAVARAVPLTAPARTIVDLASSSPTRARAGDRAGDPAELARGRDPTAAVESRQASAGRAAARAAARRDGIADPRSSRAADAVATASGRAGADRASTSGKWR